MHAIRLELMMSPSILFFIEGGNALKLELIGNMLTHIMLYFIIKEKQMLKGIKTVQLIKKTLIS